MNKNVLLLKTLLLSTSRVNILKYSKDRKKKGKIIGAFAGLFILYAMLMAYTILISIGFGEFGMIASAPVMCALVISTISFVFTVLKTNGYLFRFKEYDMLMSLPFEAHTVAACKFLYMYVKSLPWYFSISVSMMIGYGIYARPSVAAYIAWTVMTLFVPIIPMLAAAFIGFLIARISAGFRKNNMVQTILVFILTLLCFSLRFIAEAMFRNGQVQPAVEMTSEMTGKAAKIYLPAGWFAGAVTGSIADMMLLIGVSIALFGVIFCYVGKSYRNINSAMANHAAAKNFTMGKQKERSVIRSIAFKEMKRMTGSTVYMVNIGIGEVLAFVIGIISLIFGFDKIIATVTGNAPFDYSVVRPAIPFIVHFCIGMMSTTACSPSLEGKNYWIVQSLPIEKKTLYQGKMLFQMCLSVPFAVFSVLCICISSRVPIVQTLLYIILGAVLCAFSAAWGCVCGIKHMRLDWENEVEVIKQGAGVAIYMFPNMLIVIVFAALVIFLGMRMDHGLIALILIAATAALSALCYIRAMTLAKKQT